MKNIIITGGGMVNKGAQALTLITVSEMRKRFPNHHIYLYSPSDIANPNIKKTGYQFEFLGWNPMKFAYCQSKPLQRMLIKLRNGRELAAAESIYKNTDFVVDISGYALGSNWDDKICNDFLDTLEFAKHFGIPVYLMPQSFGPFDFDVSRRTLDHRIRSLLPTAKVIFAREQEGYDALVNTYGLNNVRLAGDLVLNSREIDLSKVFTTMPEQHIPSIMAQSVGVIPNSRNAEVGDTDMMLQLYDSIISDLVKSGKHVYLLSHSSIDAKVCKDIKQRFASDNRVIYLEQDFSCLEFNELVQKFEFLIASRFHSIVHAYKNGIPCVTLGWATKYHDLLKQFRQERYMFDIRGTVDVSELLHEIHYLDTHCQEESMNIRNCLSDIQKDSAFDIISEQYRSV